MKSLDARGAAAGVRQALGGELSLLSGLPGGTESAAYADALARYRDADSQAFEASNITRNGIPSAILSGRRSVLQHLPYAPASWMENNLQMIGVERRELHDLQAQMQRRRASGMLSEREELDFTNRIWAERSAIAQNLNEIGGDYSARLPELSAGRPSYTSKYNSITASADAVNRAGGYTRVFGSINGGQRAHQDSLIRDLGFSPSEISRPSPTSGLNTDPAVLNLLSKIADATSKMASSGSSGGAPSTSRPGGSGSAPGGNNPGGSMPGYFGNSYTSNGN
jgi:hypothetical protein